MYLRTRPRTSRRRGFSFRRLFVWLVAPLLILGAAGIFHMRDDIRRVIAPRIEQMIGGGVEMVATFTAPTPMPTADPSTDRRLAEAAWANGQFQEAVRLYESILPALPNDVTAHYFYTLGLIMQGRVQEAARAAENAVTANPFSSDAWAIRAMALNRAERLTDSIVSAMRAIELNPESARAHAYLAESYADLGRTTRAEQEIDDALELNPESYEARYVNAMYQWEVNFDFEAARLELQDAYDMSNGAAHVGLRLGQLLLSTAYRETQEAAGLSLLTDILDRNPDNASVLYELGFYAHRVQGDPDRAETYLRRCVSANPGNINCNYELGRTLNGLGQADEARQAFERAVNSGSLNPFHYWWAGEAQLSASADCGAAMRYFQSGYQILQDELAAGSTNFGTTQLLEDLRTTYQESMTPCMGGSAFPTPTPDPNALPTPESDA